MNHKGLPSFVFSVYTKKQIPLLAVNPKRRYSFVSNDSTKEQTCRSLEKLFVRMEERKKIE